MSDIEAERDNQFPDDFFFNETLDLVNTEAIAEVCQQYLEIIEGELNLQRFATNAHLQQLQLLLVNLLYSETYDTGWVSISKDRNQYSTRYLSLPTYRIFIVNIVNTLVSRGDLEETVGNYGLGLRSAIKASGDLLEQLTGLQDRDIHFDEHLDTMETIWLRNSEGRLVDYADDENTNAWRESLLAINQALKDHFIDIYVTDDEFHNSLRHGSAGQPIPPDLTRKYLRRSFKPSFEYGGRFNGGWWQYIHKPWRRLITIHNEHTVECDYNTMNAELLYALYDGQRPEGSLYELQELQSPRARDAIKYAFLIMLNTRSKQHAIGTVHYKVELGELGISASELVNLIEHKHQTVNQCFYNNIGTALQRVESNITEKVMLRAIRERNTVVLPVHDSFIINHRYLDWLYDVMLEAFEEETGGQCGADFELDAPYDPFNIPDNEENRMSRSRYYNNKHEWEMDRYGELDPSDPAPGADFV